VVLDGTPAESVIIFMDFNLVHRRAGPVTFVQSVQQGDWQNLIVVQVNVLETRVELVDAKPPLNSIEVVEECSAVLDFWKIVCFFRSKRQRDIIQPFSSDKITDMMCMANQSQDGEYPGAMSGHIAEVWLFF
jgi:hypothetical protein